MLTRKNMTGPWAGLPVAWDGDDCFDEDTYHGDVIRCCRAGVPGIYTGGTTGEFYAMEFDEFQSVARVTVEACRAHDMPVMIGCSSTYTLGAMRRAAYAAEIGADGIQVALPFWLEVAEAEIVPFFEQVSEASGGLALSIYETTRAKRTLTVGQHRAVFEAVPRYVMAKANAGTVGSTPEGCAALSQFVNVFVGECLWSSLGPAGAIGCCSAMIFWNPRVVLEYWSALERRDWAELNRLAEPVEALHDFLAGRFEPEGYTDTSFDHMVAVATGFLRTSLRNRGPYRSGTPEDVEITRQWLRENYPAMLALS